MLEKSTHECPAILPANTSDDLGLVVQTMVMGEVVQRARRSPFGIVGSENESCNSGMNDRSHAHEAGLDRNI